MGVDLMVRFKTSQPLVDLQKESYDLVMAFSHSDFYGPGPVFGMNHHDVIELGTEDEGYYTVAVSWRWYGAGYERGPWPRIAALFKYLQLRYDAVVEFGSDSSGDYREATQEYVDTFWKHWALYGNAPYFHRSPFHKSGPVPQCHGRDMSCNGGGGGTDFFYCGYCTRRANRLPDGTIEEKGFAE